MSRVDEALQRAATNRTDGSGLDVAKSTTAGDAAEFLNEPFRDEPADPEVGRESALASTPVQPTRAAEAPSIRPVMQREPAGLPQFEHVDTQMAGKTVIDPDTAPIPREQYRRIGAALHHHREMTGLKVVMITSAAVGEGKTLTATNLALTLSESYQKKVLLIDADLRRPSVQKIFGIDDGPGLSESLMAIGGSGLAVHRLSRRLGVVIAGQPTSDPIAGLTSERMRRTLDEARDQFDWVIIDTPPVALLPDASLLSAMVDGVVFVIRANGPSYQLVQRAVDAVGRSKIVGIVLNHATIEAEGASADDYYEYYYTRSAVNASPVGAS